MHKFRLHTSLNIIASDCIVRCATGIKILQPELGKTERNRHRPRAPLGQTLGIRE